VRTVDVLRQIPGLAREQLYFWEKQGYVTPCRVRWGRRNVREYSEADVQKISQMFALCLAGFSPKAAHEKTALHQWASRSNLASSLNGTFPQRENVSDLTVVFRSQTLSRLVARIMPSLSDTDADFALATDATSAVVLGAAAQRAVEKCSQQFPAVLAWEGKASLQAHGLVREARVLIVFGPRTPLPAVADVCGQIESHGGRVVKVLALVESLKEADEGKVAADDTSGERSLREEGPFVSRREGDERHSEEAMIRLGT